MSSLAAALQPNPRIIRHRTFPEPNPIIPFHIVLILQKQMASRMQERLMSIPDIACSKNSYIEARIRKGDFAVRGVFQFEPERRVGRVFDPDDLSPRHDLVLPFPLVRFVQALVIHLFIHTV